MDEDLCGEAALSDVAGPYRLVSSFAEISEPAFHGHMHRKSI